jgi:hypothetical protein
MNNADGMVYPPIRLGSSYTNRRADHQVGRYAFGGLEERVAALPGVY